MNGLAGVVLLVSSFIALSHGTCPVMFCKSFCTNGYQMGSNNCNTCHCLSEPRTGAEDRCEELSCYAPCPFGYEQENGCPSCKCAPDTAVKPAADATFIKDNQASPCPDVYCLVPCTSGYEQDDQGCPICSCQDADNQGGANPSVDKTLNVSKEEWTQMFMKILCRVLQISSCGKMGVAPV